MNKFLIFAIVLGIASAQVTQLELLQAWNYARTNPNEIKKRITKNFINKGIKGVYNDEACYTSAVKFLESQKSVASLTEEAGIDLSAYAHSKDLLTKVKKLTHDGSDKSSPESRLKKFGRFFGKYNLFEMVTFRRQKKLVSANDIIDSLITDCKLKSRNNRKFIFSTEVTHFGAGVALKKGKLFVTLMGTKGYTSKAISNKQLENSKVYGNANYKGKGVSRPVTRWKDKKEVKKGKKKVINTITPSKKIDDSTGPLGDLKDDKSVKCPTYVNSKELEKKVIKKWTITSKKCVRGKGDFTRTDNLARYAPFAKKKHCYHRLAYCSTQGRVWVFDRQYKTLDEVDVRAAQKPEKSTLGELKHDKSVDCPQWVNGNLRKRIVQDWYKNGKKCSRGESGFSKKGFRANRAVAKDRKCYQRNEFCCKNGHVWVKDSEYLTFAEYEARKL